MHVRNIGMYVRKWNVRKYACFLIVSIPKWNAKNYERNARNCEWNVNNYKCKWEDNKYTQMKVLVIIVIKL